MAGGIIVVTDSSACLPASAADPHGIRVVPLRTHIGADVHRDDAPRAIDIVLDHLRRGDETKTSPPSASDYLLAIERAPADGAVVVTPAREFTVMARNAALAAELASVPVAVVDSRTAAAAAGLVALAAARTAQTDPRLDAVVRAAERSAARVDLVAQLGGMQPLARGGRVGADVLQQATAFGLRPVFRLRGGCVEPLGLPQDRSASLQLLRDEWAARGGGASELTVVFHAGDGDAAARLAGCLAAPCEVVGFSAAMTAHTGSGVVGLAWTRPG